MRNLLSSKAGRIAVIIVFTLIISAYIIISATSQKKTVLTNYHVTSEDWTTNSRGEYYIAIADSHITGHNDVEIKLGKEFSEFLQSCNYYYKQRDGEVDLVILSAPPHKDYSIKSITINNE